MNVTVHSIEFETWRVKRGGVRFLLLLTSPPSPTTGTGHRSALVPRLPLSVTVQPRIPPSEPAVS